MSNHQEKGGREEEEHTHPAGTPCGAASQRAAVARPQSSWL
jgi:hypothetical protein